MRFVRLVLFSVVLVSSVGALQTICCAQDQKPAPNHVHYKEPAQQTVSPTGAVAPRLQKLGNHKFPVSTKNAQAQLFMNQGLNLSYAFNHAEAGRAYREAERLDPKLAMAFWGEALALGPNINAPMDPASEPKALEAINKAVALKANASPREQALIDALTNRYSGRAEDRKARDVAYADAMRKVHLQFPDDDDISMLYVESVMDLRPWGYWTKDGTPYERTSEVVALTEKVIAHNQNHPGALHLYIHLMEAYQADKAEAAADRLLTLMPAAGHMVHMPAHIYLWFDWAALFCLWIAIVNVASVLIFDVVLSGLRLRAPRILRDLLLALGYLIVGITLLAIPKVNITGIVATSAVLTAVIGLSFQDTLGNMMAGMALQMERAISVGDWIRIDNQEGMVKEIRWRHTAIETRNWDTIVVPNSALMKSQVIVLGRRTGQPRQHRQWVYFNIDFRYSPADVIDAVETALRAEPIANIAATPPPNCVLMDFKESYGSYAVRYWLTDLAVDDPTNSVVRTRIYFALRRANIPLSIPSHSLFVTEAEQARVQRRHEEIEIRANALQKVELFQNLTDQEREQLADRIRIAPFVRGEAMTKQGAEAHWLYIITRGDAEVRLSLDGNLSERVATLHPGDFFGERGMMTGERRSATVIALTDVECYRVDKDAFHDILRSRPEIAEDISEVLARRHAELEATRENLSDEAKRARIRQHKGDLLQRIKNFFAL